MNDGRWNAVRNKSMVGRNEKLMSFEVVSEMFDCKVNRKKFTSKGAVSSLCRLETFGEKPNFCWRTAPTAKSEASVVRHSGASGLGWDNKVESARAFLMLSKAEVADSVHTNGPLRVFLVGPVEQSMSVRG